MHMEYCWMPIPRGLFKPGIPTGSLYLKQCLCQYRNINLFTWLIWYKRDLSTWIPHWQILTPRRPIRVRHLLTYQIFLSCGLLEHRGGRHSIRTVCILYIISQISNFFVTLTRQWYQPASHQLSQPSFINFNTDMYNTLKRTFDISKM